ncbi:MAG TPA: dihydroorotase [Candidatus Competibacter sp.]|nr:dihydroorotase [Candidatus Competibacteraceae bacterium]HRE55395.1 dihydroorotase [Candidatus Competibacter sp.]HUM93178.1 dihydroorotase [Candidatus Competibacter sp.]
MAPQPELPNAALTLTRPDDWHLHVRDGDALRAVAPHTARQFARAIIMPNLNPPVTTTEQALAYRGRILDAVPPESDFQPLMTLYLTDTTAPAEIVRAKASGHVVAGKLYPAGATTHSASGVTDVRKIYPVLEAMQAQGLRLLVHGEVTDPAVDIFDREAVFIERVLIPLVRDFPALKIVLEHITTQDAADYVREAPVTVAATITAHHLLYNRNAIFQGGIRPHYYCLPVLKRERHRQALLQAATGGNPKYFLGTDSAPHPRQGKEAACGCAGCYTAYAALELYAEAFESAGALDRLEAFASVHGPDFYGLPRNAGTITLRRQMTPVPEYLAFGDDQLVPLRAGSALSWSVG